MSSPTFSNSSSQESFSSNSDASTPKFDSKYPGNLLNTTLQSDCSSEEFCDCCCECPCPLNSRGDVIDKIVTKVKYKLDNSCNFYIQDDIKLSKHLYIQDMYGKDVLPSNEVDIVFPLCVEQFFEEKSSSQKW